MASPDPASDALQERFRIYREQQATQKRLPGERSNPFDDLRYPFARSTSPTQGSTNADDGHGGEPEFSWRLRVASEESPGGQRSPTSQGGGGADGLNGGGGDGATLSEALAAFAFPTKETDGGENVTKSLRTTSRPNTSTREIDPKSTKQSAQPAPLGTSNHRRLNSRDGSSGMQRLFGKTVPTRPTQTANSSASSIASSQSTSAQGKPSSIAVKGFMVKPRYEPLPPMPLRMRSKDHSLGQDVDVRSGQGIMPLPSPFIRTLRGEQGGYVEHREEEARESRASPTPMDKRAAKVLPTPPESPTNTFKKSNHVQVTPTAKRVPPPIFVPQSAKHLSPAPPGQYLSPTAAESPQPSPKKPAAARAPTPAPSPPKVTPVCAAQELLDSYALDEDFLSMYEIRDELGSGGFGVVCSAVRRTDGKAVAVKFIFKDRLHHKAQVHDWHRRESAVGILPGEPEQKGWQRRSISGGVRLIPMEAAVLQYCHHPGIVAFVGLYEDETFFYLVQELHGTPWSISDNADSGESIPRPSSAEPTKPLFDLSPALQNRRNTNPFETSISPPAHSGIKYANVDSENGLLTPSSSAKSLAEMQAYENGEMGDSPRPGGLRVSVDGPEGIPVPLAKGGRPAPILRRSSHDLFECIEMEGRFGEDDARHVFKQVVEAVAYLHRNGICHRDIKDENIVIDDNLDAKIIDFGSAVIYDPRKPAPYYDRFFGTLNFASAEIIDGYPYQAAPAEVWSLGVLLSIILTGVPPYESYKHAAKGYLRLKHAIPRDASDLIWGCMRIDPKKRYTIEDVRRHPWLTGENVFPTGGGYYPGYGERDKVNGDRPIAVETTKSYPLRGYK